MVCAALPPSLQQTECTHSKQVGPVVAGPSKTQCSAVELARRNGCISAAANAEVGPRPPGAAGRFGFLNGLCSLAGREGSEAKCKNLGTELKASHGFSQQEPGLSETHWMTSYLKKRFYHPRAFFLCNDWSSLGKSCFKSSRGRVEKKRQRGIREFTQNTQTT